MIRNIVKRRTISTPLHYRNTMKNYGMFWLDIETGIMYNIEDRKITFYLFIFKSFKVVK